MNKIYETDSYRKECDTVITGVISTPGGTYISIEDSIFFPEQGGQYADTGVIQCKGLEFTVLDGIVSSGNADKNGVVEACKSKDPDKTGDFLPPGVWYRVDHAESCKTSCNNLTDITDTLVTNAQIHCILDFSNRFDRMQNHTGEHILTGTVHNDYGYDNVGFHLSDDGFVTLDLNGVLTYEQVIEEEAKANAVVYANIPVKASFPSEDELRTIDYRSKSGIEGPVRLVTIGDDKRTVDICACCAPHVAYTGEVGLIKVISVINWKGGVRISILCGRRALEYIGHRQDIVNELTDLLSTNEDNLAEVVRSHIEEIGTLKAGLAAAYESAMAHRILSHEPDIERTHLIFTEDDFPAASLKNVYNLLKNTYSGYVGIFMGDDKTGYRYCAGSRDVSSKTLIPILSSSLRAKGGGSDEMIQGRVSASREEIERVFTGIKAV